MSPCLTSARNIHIRGLKFFSILHMSEKDRHTAMSIGFEVRNKCTHMESVNNEN